MAMFATAQVYSLFRIKFTFEQYLSMLDISQALRTPDGGFRANPEGECEARTTYVTVCALYLASGGFRFDGEEWNAAQKSEARFRTTALLEDTPHYLIRSQALGGGFGSNSLETHCAYTFCALGGLKMLGKLY